MRSSKRCPLCASRHIKCSHLRKINGNPFTIRLNNQILELKPKELHRVKKFNKILVDQVEGFIDTHRGKRRITSKESMVFYIRSFILLGKGLRSEEKKSPEVIEVIIIDDDDDGVIDLTQD